MPRAFKSAGDGSISIETALGFMMMMTMVLGIIECCLMAYTYSVLEDSVRDGVRYASTHGADSSTCSGPGTGSGTACTDPTAANVKSTVATYAGQYCGNLGGMVVTVTYPDGSRPQPHAFK